VFLSVGKNNFVQGREALRAVMEQKGAAEAVQGLRHHILSMEVKTYPITRGSVCYSLLQMEIQTCCPDGSFTQVNQRITALWHYHRRLKYSPDDVRTGWFSDHVHISIGVEVRQTAPIARHISELLAQGLRPSEDNTPYEMLDTEGHTRFFRVLQIVHIEAVHAMSRIYLASGDSFIVNKSMNEMAALLIPQRFVRIHKSHLVNARNVKMIERYQATLLDETKLPISRDQYMEVKRILQMLQK
jgi:hypothetical protein